MNLLQCQQVQNYTSLEDRWANISRSKTIFASSVCTHSHTFSFSNSFDSVTHCVSTVSRLPQGRVELYFKVAALLQRVHRHILALFWKIYANLDLSAVDIYIWVGDKFVHHESVKCSALYVSPTKKDKMLEYFNPWLVNTWLAHVFHQSNQVYVLSLWFLPPESSVDKRVTATINPAKVSFIYRCTSRYNHSTQCETNTDIYCNSCPHGLSSS